jgi:magnesium-transporting ATPase (P-type)
VSGAGVVAPAGLSEAEAGARLERDGPNVLPPPPGRAVLAHLAEQFLNFFALVLWVAAGLALLAGLPELSVAITAVVVLNGLFAFAQEQRADRAVARLRDLVPASARVRRDGSLRDVPTAEVVAGDVLVLGAGDRVAADARLAVVHRLAVDTSMITGESVPQRPDPGGAIACGCFVVEGEGEAEVTATGAHTRMATLARLASATARRPGPLAAALRRTVRTISWVALGTGLLFLVVGVALGMGATTAVVLALGITVALVPEGLLPTVTLSLALGAQRMARRNALVRRLEAVETLGSTTVVCTDKTGTLTLNAMTAVVVWTPAGGATVSGPGYGPVARITYERDTGAEHAVLAAARAGARASTGRAVERAGAWQADGDPMEAALDALARRAGLDLDADREAMPDRLRFPFDTRRRRMAVVAGTTVFVKGAPDAVIPRCTDRGAADDAVARLARRGLRVLAVAERALRDGDPATDEEAERDLTLLGLVGLEDPPRPNAAATLAVLREAGVAVAMVTGDHPVTAAAIADEVGLRTAGAPVLLGADLPDDTETLGELLDHDGVVVARVSPEDKVRIATALQARGHVVAMTGDGVNDAPALHMADIGVAMGRSGTDVAREAADLVLLDDDLATVAAAIEQGRATYQNVRRFLTYHLTDNVAEVTPFVLWAVTGGRFPLALGVLQILALDIGTDTFSAVALGAEQPAPGTLRQRPVSGRLLDRTVAIRAFGLLGPLEGIAAVGAFALTLAVAGWTFAGPLPPAATLLSASGAAFATIALAQTANAFACRSSTRRPGQIGWLSNRLLVAAVSVELAITGACLLLPALASHLGHAVPGAAGWLVAVLSMPAVLTADAAWKAWRGAHRP